MVRLKTKYYTDDLIGNNEDWDAVAIACFVEEERFIPEWSTEEHYKGFRILYTYDDLRAEPGETDFWDFNQFYMKKNKDGDIWVDQPSGQRPAYY